MCVYQPHKGTTWKEFPTFYDMIISMLGGCWSMLRNNGCKRVRLVTEFSFLFMSGIIFPARLFWSRCLKYLLAAHVWTHEIAANKYSFFWITTRIWNTSAISQHKWKRYSMRPTNVMPRWGVPWNGMKKELQNFKRVFPLMVSSLHVQIATPQGQVGTS